MAVPTEVISAAIGLTGAGMSLWTYWGTLLQQRNREVREQLLHLVDLSARAAELYRTQPAAYVASTERVNQKRSIHLAIANELAEKTHRPLTAYDCMSLGYENLADNNYRSARSHYERAEKVSSPTRRNQCAHRRLASARWYFITSPVDQDVARGVSYFEQAAAMTQANGNAGFIRTTAMTYEQWGRALAAVGDEHWHEVVQRARTTYEKLPEQSYYREVSLATVDELLSGAVAASTAPAPLRPEEPT